MIALLCLPSLVALAVSSHAPVPAADRESCENVSVAAAARSLLQSQNTHTGTRTPHRYAVTKKVVSSNIRFVFFAGLEGTGHHFWKEMLRRLSISHSADLSQELFNRRHGPGLFSSSDEQIREASAEHVVELMSEMQKNLSSVPGCNVVALNVGGITHPSGMMSYPNFGGRDRMLQNPDMFTLAKLAEAAGIDLRIVLLTRHPASLVQSELDRSYEKDLSHAVRKVSMTLALLSEQLDLLDPSYVSCWTYEDPEARISHLLSFMGLCEEDSDHVRQIIKEIYKPSNHSSRSNSLRESLDTGFQIHVHLLAKWCA